MSLSAHERNEFERLTAGLTFDDSDLKKMTKRDKATAMSYVALPSLSTILMVLAVVGIVVGVVGANTHNAILVAVGGAGSLCLIMCSMFCSEKELFAAYHKAQEGTLDNSNRKMTKSAKATTVNFSAILLGLAACATILSIGFMTAAHDPVAAFFSGIIGMAICFGTFRRMNAETAAKSRKMREEQ